VSKPRYPVTVRLSDQDGNGVFIIGRVSKALKRAGVHPSEVKKYVEAATSGDYDNLLEVTEEWVDVE